MNGGFARPCEACGRCRRRDRGCRSPALRRSANSSGGAPRAADSPARRRRAPRNAFRSRSAASTRYLPKRPVREYTIPAPGRDAASLRPETADGHARERHLAPGGPTPRRARDDGQRWQLCAPGLAFPRPRQSRRLVRLQGRGRALHAGHGTLLPVGAPHGADAQARRRSRARSRSCNRICRRARAGPIPADWTTSNRSTAPSTCIRSIARPIPTTPAAPPSRCCGIARRARSSTTNRPRSSAC